MKANRSADFGKWLTTAGGIQPGKTYHFEALYRPENIAREDVSVAVILSWCSDENCKALIQNNFRGVRGGFSRLQQRLRRFRVFS
jgi:hypothetical protein